MSRTHAHTHTHTHMRARLPPRQEYEYELTVFNVLSRVALDITVNDFLPSDLQYTRVESTPITGTLNCSSAVATNTITCSLSKLDPFESVTLFVVVLVNNSATAKTIRNIASVHAAQGDSGERDRFSHTSAR